MDIYPMNLFIPEPITLVIQCITNYAIMAMYTITYKAMEIAEIVHWGQYYGDSQNRTDIVLMQTERNTTILCPHYNYTKCSVVYVYVFLY